MKLQNVLIGAGLTALLAGAAWAGDEPKKERHEVTIICHKGPGGPGHDGPGHGGPGGPHMMMMRMHGDMAKHLGPDGSITREAFLAMHGGIFDEMDKNHDGKLTPDEMHGGMHDAMHGDGDMKVRVEHGEGGGDVKIIQIEGGGHGEHGDMAGMHEGMAEGMECSGGPDGHGPMGEHMKIMMLGHGGEHDGEHGGGFDGMDKNHDGKISFDEFAAPIHEAFEHLDKNHDGFVDKTEWPGDDHFRIRRVEKHIEKK